MATTDIQEDSPSYYPPRARWYSPVFYGLAWIKRRGMLDQFIRPDQIKASELIGGFLAPGLAIWFRGPKRWGLAALGASAILTLVFIVFLGFPEANLAFGLLMALHCSGFIYYCSPFLAFESLRGRMGVTMLVLLSIGLLLYRPGRDLILRHWLPLRLHGHVLVVQRLIRPDDIQRGDWMAYAMHEQDTGEAHNGGAVWVRGGMGIGPVLASAGDEVSFSTNGFSVNGASRPLLAHMPTSGGFTVATNHWFVWPNVDISGHGNTREETITDAMLSMAEVDKKQYFGKPFKRWFGRKQILP